MRKLFFLLTIVFLSSVSLNAQQATAKTYKVEAEINVWNAVLDGLEKSTASHVDIKTLQNFIATQIQQQITADQKKTIPKQKADSSGAITTKPAESKKNAEVKKPVK